MEQNDGASRVESTELELGTRLTRQKSETVFMNYHSSEQVYQSVESVVRLWPPSSHPPRSCTSRQHHEPDALTRVPFVQNYTGHLFGAHLHSIAVRHPATCPTRRRDSILLTTNPRAGPSCPAASANLRLASVRCGASRSTTALPLRRACRPIRPRGKQALVQAHRRTSWLASSTQGCFGM